MNRTPVCEGCGKDNIRYRVECKLYDLEPVGEGEQRGVISDEFVVDSHVACFDKVFGLEFLKAVKASVARIDSEKDKHGLR